jgi:SAM-dependent methyltransferase
VTVDGGVPSPGVPEPGLDDDPEPDDGYEVFGDGRDEVPFGEAVPFDHVVPRTADTMGDHWERHAGWWQEEFTEGADPEYVEQILPLATEHLASAYRVLDVGTGEGQLARLAVTDGAEFVIGIDPTHAQVEEAVRRGGGPAYLLGCADGLPFADESFDAAVACLVFEHIDAIDEAMAEIARVLEPGGRFLLFLNHPLLQTPDSGWVDDHVLGERYWRVGPYLDEAVTLEEVSPGVTLPFAHRPLSRYVNALAAQGLLLVHMAEPPPTPGFVARAAEYAEASHIPRLLLLVTTKVELEE